MTDDDLHAYLGSYENFIIRGLDQTYADKALIFKTLVIAERGLSVIKTPIPEKVNKTKKLLARAFTRLSQSAEFRSFRHHFEGWQQELQAAGSATDIGELCKRASLTLFPEVDF